MMQFLEKLQFPCTKYHLASPYLDTQFLNDLSLDIQRIDSIGTSVFQVCTKLRRVKHC